MRAEGSLLVVQALFHPQTDGFLVVTRVNAHENLRGGLSSGAHSCKVTSVFMAGHL